MCDFQECLPQWSIHRHLIPSIGPCNLHSGFPTETPRHAAFVTEKREIAGFQIMLYGMTTLECPHLTLGANYSCPHHYPTHHPWG